MSLIHDALRKAAEENQNRHGQRDRPASWRDVAPPPPPKRSPWPWVTAAAFLAAGGALLLWTQLRPGPAAPPPVAAAVAPAAVPAKVVPPAVEPPTAQPVAEEPASPPPPAAPAPVPALPESRPAPPPAATPADTAEKMAPAPPPVEGQAPPPPASPPPTPATSAPVPAPAAAPNPAAPKLIVPPAQTGQVDGDTYVLEAEVEGKRLLLDFIVWSDAPFAQINGRQVGVGQQVEGFVVTDIARESVLLETPTRRIRLRVR